MDNKYVLTRGHKCSTEGCISCASEHESNTTTSNFFNVLSASNFNLRENGNHLTRIGVHQYDAKGLFMTKWPVDQALLSELFMLRCRNDALSYRAYRTRQRVVRKNRTHRRGGVFYALRCSEFAGCALTCGIKKKQHVHAAFCTYSW